MSLVRFGVPLVAFVVGAAIPVLEAHAHGRFPQAGSIVIDPSDEDRIWVRTTYGVITTDDGGAGWRWICPEGVGFNADNEDPSLVIFSDGSVVLGTFDGLSLSTDRCDFDFVGGDLAERYFIDVIPEPGDASAVALSSNGIASDSFEVFLWESADNGHNWAQFGTATPPDFLALSVGVAASDSDRIYLTGRDGTGGTYAGALYRSDDRAMTWTRFDVPGTENGMVLPYMAAIAPDDPDVVYLGLFQEEMGAIVYFALVVSDDGGATWQTIFERNGEVTAFAMSPDGDKLAVGGADEGVWTADSTTRMFAKVNDQHTRCLTWHASGLYACADQFKDGYNLAVSHDDGATFSALSQQSSPCGPPETCGQGTSVGDECPARWPEEQVELGAPESCSAEGGAGGGEGGAAGEPSSGSCGCKVEPRDDGDFGLAAGLFALAGAALAALRRRIR